MRLNLLVLAALAALAAPAPAAAPAQPKMSEREAALVRQALDRGKLVYVYDRVAWHGTDDLRTKLPGFEKKIAGWIVDGPPESPQLIFYDRNEADPRIVYVGDFRGTELAASRLIRPGEDDRLSPQRRAMIAARNAALDALVKGKAKKCTDGPINTVVLPPAAPGAPTLVYVLTPQTDLKAVPMGGHYLVEVAADGRAGKPRAFTKSCMEMPLVDEKGDRPKALIVTHLLDPLPTEIHVFSSLAARVPIYVLTATGGRTWSVEGSRILLVDTR